MADAFPDRSAIALSQLAQLRALVDALIPGNAFYSRKLEAAGAPGKIGCLEDFFRDVPFTTKQEIVDDQQRHPPYGTNQTFPLGHYTRFHQTSGTTAAPIRWIDTPESWNAMIDCWVEVFQAAGVTGADRVFFAFSFGPFLGFWLAFEAAERLGCLCIPGGGLSSAARLRVMIDNAATILCCTPTYAGRLAEVATQEKIDIGRARVKTLVVAGEAGGSIPATRTRLTQLWNGARTFDHHGMTEVGPVTYECPERPGSLHVMESAFLAEIIDPTTTRPVDEGETGELVLTTLRRIGSPLLRYRTGDLVQRGTPNAECGMPCACGRSTLRLNGGILGRVDDMIVVRGVNIYPSAVEEVIRSSAQVAEYQVTVSHVNSLAELSLRIEPTPDCADASGLARRLETLFQDTFTLRVPVTSVPAGTLPRFEMKASRWKREGPNPV